MATLRIAAMRRFSCSASFTTSQPIEEGWHVGPQLQRVAPARPRQHDSEVVVGSTDVDRPEARHPDRLGVGAHRSERHVLDEGDGGGVGRTRQVGGLGAEQDLGGRSLGVGGHDAPAAVVEPHHGARSVRRANAVLRHVPEDRQQRLVDGRCSRDAVDRRRPDGSIGRRTWIDQRADVGIVQVVVGTMPLQPPVAVAPQAQFCAGFDHLVDDLRGHVQRTVDVVVFENRHHEGEVVGVEHLQPVEADGVVAEDPLQDELTQRMTKSSVSSTVAAPVPLSSALKARSDQLGLHVTVVDTRGT